MTKCCLLQPQSNICAIIQISFIIFFDELHDDVENVFHALLLRGALATRIDGGNN